MQDKTERSNEHEKLMKIDKFTTTTSNQDQLLITLGNSAEQAIFDQFGEALREAARYYVDKNMDKITAKLDMAGLANLIAIYASKKLAESANEMSPRSLSDKIERSNEHEKR